MSYRISAAAGLLGLGLMLTPASATPFGPMPLPEAAGTVAPVQYYGYGRPYGYGRGYGYGPRFGYGRRFYGGPRWGYGRRFYGPRPFYGPRYGYRPFY